MLHLGCHQRWRSIIRNLNSKGTLLSSLLPCYPESSKRDFTTSSEELVVAKVSMSTTASTPVSFPFRFDKDLIPSAESNGISSKIKYQPPSTSLLDTHSIILDLEKSGFTCAQSEALLEVFQGLLALKFSKLEKNLVHGLQIENDSYMIKSRCHEIRLDLQTLNNKQLIENKYLHEKSTSEINNLFEQLRDAFDILQTEAKMRLHFYKADNREELQKIDSNLHHENGLLTVTMSDIKTNVETVKLKAIYSFTMALLFLFMIIIIERSVAKEKEKQKKKKANSLVYDDDLEESWAKT